MYKAEIVKEGRIITTIEGEKMDETLRGAKEERSLLNQEEIYFYNEDRWGRIYLGQY